MAQEECRVLGLLQRLRGLHARHGIEPLRALEEVDQALAHPAVGLRLEGQRRARAPSGQGGPQVGPPPGPRRAARPGTRPPPRAERAEAQHLAAGADRLPQAQGRRRDEDDVRARGRLLQALEQRVLGRLVHRVGVVDHEHAPARLERGPRDLADQVPHLVDTDLGLGPRPTGLREPPALGEHEVGVQAEVRATRPRPGAGRPPGAALPAAPEGGRRTPCDSDGTRRRARARAPARTSPPAPPRGRGPSCPPRPAPRRAAPAAAGRARVPGRGSPRTRSWPRTSSSLIAPVLRPGPAPRARTTALSETASGGAVPSSLIHREGSCARRAS